jgi:hypothetical protein
MKLDKDMFRANMNMVKLRAEDYGSAISGRVSQKQGGCHRGGEAAEDDQAQKSERWLMEEEQEKQATISFIGHFRHPHG